MKYSIINKILLTGFLGALLHTEAKAQSENLMGVFIEPALTYQISDTDVNYPSPFSNSTGNVDGFGIGARVGAHINQSILLGLDARYAMPDFDDSSVNYNSRAIATNYGPVVALQMPEVGL